MIKKILALLLVAMMCLLSGCGGGAFQDTAVEQISPESDAARTEKMVVQLYYGNADLRYLVAESRSIDVSANDPLEVSVLRALIDGPQVANGEYNYLINRDTQVVGVNSSGGVLTVILSAKFLEWPATVSEATQRELAVYSIVNTLVESTGYAQVQLLVDRDANGVGQRIRMEELGFASTGSILDVLERNGSLELTPQNTMKCICEAMLRKDYDAVYPFIAYNDTYGAIKADEASFRAQVQEAAPTLEGYSIRETVISDNGQAAVVMMDYTLRLAAKDATTRTNIPTFLIKENGIWKQRYSAFEDIFLTGEVSTQ